MVYLQNQKMWGRVVARNPFNIKKDQYYDAYIYKINYKKIPNCVKRTSD